MKQTYSLQGHLNEFNNLIDNLKSFEVKNRGGGEDCYSILFYLGSHSGLVINLSRIFVDLIFA